MISGYYIVCVGVMLFCGRLENFEKLNRFKKIRRIPHLYSGL